MKRVLLCNSKRLNKVQTLYESEQNLMWALAMTFSDNYNNGVATINVDSNNKYINEIKYLFNNTDNVTVSESTNSTNITIVKSRGVHLTLSTFLDLFIMIFKPTEIYTNTLYKVYDISNKYIYNNLLACLHGYKSLDDMSNAIYNIITSNDNIIYRDKHESDYSAISRHIEVEDVYCSVFKIKKEKNKHAKSDTNQ